MSDKLAIVNNALAETGNNLCQEADGSEEWNVASRAYDRALPVMISAHPFNWATTIETLSAAESNPSERFEYAYRIPLNALHIRTVYVGGIALAGSSYEIIDRTIATSSDSIEVLYVRRPPEDQWPPLFNEALTLRVEAGILRGLNEDFDEATRRQGLAMAMLHEAKNAADQQAPGRTILKSRMAARRRGAVPGVAR